MAIGISESAIDQITVEGNTFPVGGAIGVFYQNQDNEYVCSGAIIWDYQSNVIPVLYGKFRADFEFLGFKSQKLVENDQNRHFM